MSKASRAQRLAVKTITGSKKALRKAAKLERGVYGAYIQGLIELAQAYGHRDAEGCYRAAPYTTEQQVVLDEYYAAEWNAWRDEHHPDLDAQAVVFGPHDGGGTRLIPLDQTEHGRVVRQNHIASVPFEAIKGHGVEFHLDRPLNDGVIPPKREPSKVRGLTKESFAKLTMIYLYAEAARVDPAAFRAGANLAWQASLRHKVAGKRVNDDPAGRDNLDELAKNQAEEFRRQSKRIHDVLEGQIRADPNSKDVTLGYAHKFQHGHRARKTPTV